MRMRATHFTTWCLYSKRTRALTFSSKLTRALTFEDACDTLQAEEPAVGWSHPPWLVRYFTTAFYYCVLLLRFTTAFYYCVLLLCFTTVCYYCVGNVEATSDTRPTQLHNRYNICREHILWQENTFYGKRTHSMAREHILWQENTFHSKRTHSMVREHILWQENTFNGKRIHSTAREHILQGYARKLTALQVWCLHLSYCTHSPNKKKM